MKQDEIVDGIIAFAEVIGKILETLRQNRIRALAWLMASSNGLNFSQLEGALQLGSGATNHAINGLIKVGLIERKEGRFFLAPLGELTFRFCYGFYNLIVDTDIPPPYIPKEKFLMDKQLAEVFFAELEKIETTAKELSKRRAEFQKRLEELEKLKVQYSPSLGVEF